MKKSAVDPRVLRMQALKKKAYKKWLAGSNRRILERFSLATRFLKLESCSCYEKTLY